MTYHQGELFFYTNQQKPPRGTVPFGGFEVLLKMKKSSIYAALSPKKPPIGTVPLGDQQEPSPLVAVCKKETDTLLIVVELAFAF